MRESRKSFYREFSVLPGMQQRGLYVVAAGKADREPGHGCPTRATHPDVYQFDWTRGRSLPFFHLAWITRGKGECQWGQTPPVPLLAGSVLLIPPGSWHRYRPSFGSGWTEKWVGFNGDFVRELVRSGAVDSQPGLIHPVSAERFEGPFDQLLERALDPDPAVEQQLAAHVFHLLTLAVAAVRSSARPTLTQCGHRLVADAVSIINQTGREAITVEDLVDEMLVARRTLERAFRKQLGHGIHEEILQSRLNRTVMLLADRSLSIDEVAIGAGFGNVRSLRRAFAAAKGMSPQAYRNLISSDPKAA